MQRCIYRCILAEFVLRFVHQREDGRVGMLQLWMQKEGVSSFDALGKELRHRYPGLEWPSARSLGVKLGQLDKGAATWWAKRIDFTNKLAELLKCDPRELGVHSAESVHLPYYFEDFPELPPLDLSREGPCDLGCLVGKQDLDEKHLAPWFGRTTPGQNLVTTVNGVSWLHFPPGTGRDLYWARLNALSPFECVSTTALSTLSERLQKPSPICINLNRDNGHRDLLVLSSRNPECPILICAPFDLPSRPAAGWKEVLEWDYQLDTLEERNLRTLTNSAFSAFDGGANRYRFALYRDWRTRLITWILNRLRTHLDTRLGPAQLEAWLDGFRNQDVFDTPRSIVAICRFAHRFGRSALPDPTNRRAGAAFLELHFEKPVQQLETFHQVVHSWLTDPDIHWNTLLTTDGRRRLHERTLAPSADPLISALADEADPAVRSKMAERLKETFRAQRFASLAGETAPPDAAIMEAEHAPRFLRDLVARDDLLQMVLTGSHKQWGSLCFEHTRAHLAMDALSLLTTEELQEVLKNLIEHYQDDAAGIGAAEALFCIIGQKGPQADLSMSTAEALATTVLRRLSRASFDPQPWSSVASSAAEGAWVSACWGWSLTLARSPIELPDAWAAFFPGWAAFPEAIDWTSIASLAVDKDSNLDFPARTYQLLQHAEVITDRFQEIPATVPDILIPLLILRAEKKNWAIPSAWWRFALTNHWAEELLIEHWREGSLTRPLCSLLESLASDGEGHAGHRPPGELTGVQIFMLKGMPLRKHLFDRSQPSELFQLLSPRAVRAAFSLFELLPERYQTALLNWYRANPAGRPSWFSIVEKLSLNLVDTVTPWLDEPEGDFVARWLWGTAPEHATAVLTGKITAATKRKLIMNQHGRHGLEQTVAALESAPDSLDAEERFNWALVRIHDSGSLAPRILHLMHMDL